MDLKNSELSSQQRVNTAQKRFNQTVALAAQRGPKFAEKIWQTVKQVGSLRDVKDWDLSVFYGSQKVTLQQRLDFLAMLQKNPTNLKGLKSLEESQEKLKARDEIIISAAKEQMFWNDSQNYAFAALFEMPEFSDVDPAVTVPTNSDLASRLEQALKSKGHEPNYKAMTGSKEPRSNIIKILALIRGFVDKNTVPLSRELRTQIKAWALEKAGLGDLRNTPAEAEHRRNQAQQHLDNLYGPKGALVIARDFLNQFIVPSSPEDLAEMNEQLRLLTAELDTSRMLFAQQSAHLIPEDRVALQSDWNLLNQLETQMTTYLQDAYPAVNSGNYGMLPDLSRDTLLGRVNII